MAVRVGGMASMGEALIKACLNGQAREVRRLLSGGADVNDADEQGGTPLMVASNNGQVEVVDRLIKNQPGSVLHQCHPQADALSFPA